MSEPHKNQSEYFRTLRNDLYDALEHKDAERIYALYKLALTDHANSQTDFDDLVPEKADFFDQVGFVCGIMEQHEIGETFAKRAQAIRRKYLDSLNHRLLALIREEEYDDALPIAHEAASLSIRIAGKEDSLYAASLNNLAFVEKELGEQSKAKSHYVEALKIWKASSDISRDPDFASGLRNLGVLYFAGSDYDNAEKYFREAIGIFRAACGADEPKFLEILAFNKSYLTAPDEDWPDEYVPLAEELVRNCHLLVECMNMLAKTHISRGNPSDAEPLYVASMQICKSLFEVNDPTSMTTYSNLLELYESQGKSAKFERLLEQVGKTLHQLSRETAFEVSPLPQIKPLFEKMAQDFVPKPAPVDEQSEELYQEQLSECIIAFIREDYSICLQNAIALNALRPSLEILQLYILSFQRLEGPYSGNDTDLIHTFVQDLETLISEEKWPDVLTRLSLGLVNIEAALARATNDQQRCQVHVYGGFRLLVEGNREAAQGQFEKAAALKLDTLERRILSDIRGASVPINRESEGELSRLNAHVTSVIQKRGFSGALSDAAAAHQFGIENQLGLESRDFRIATNNLAAVLLMTGEYVESVRLSTKLVNFFKAEAPSDVVARSAASNILGSALLELGELRDAEKSFRDAINVVTNAGKRHDAETSQSIGNLAELYRTMGHYKEAIPLYEQVIALQRESEGGDTPEYARWLNNFGILHLETGNLKSAAELLETALNIRKMELPPGHMDIASSLSWLSVLESKRGNQALMRRYAIDAFEIYKATFGEHHHKMAAVLNNLALIQLHCGDLDKAERYIRQAVSNTEASLGKSHPSLYLLYQHLALICSAGGRIEEAFEVMESSLAIQQDTIWQVFSASSDRQRVEYIGYAYLGYCLGLSFALKHNDSDRLKSKLKSFACDLILKRKGLSSEAWAIQRDELVHDEDSQRFIDLNNLRQKLAAKILRGPGVEGPEAHKNVIQEWEVEKTQLENELAHQVALPRFQDMVKANFKSVANALPRDSVLVEIARFESLDFDVLKTTNSANRSVSSYAAVVITPDQDTACLVDLGESKSIDRDVEYLRQQLTSPAVPGAKWDLGVSTAHSQRYDGTSLWKSVWKPIEKALAGKRRVYLAPDGDLCLIPFEILQREDGRLLIEDYEITYLSSGRDLLRINLPSPGTCSEPLVVADPDFDITGEANLSAREAQISQISRDFNDYNLHFSRLPGTRVEGERVAKLLGVKPLFGDEVLDSTIKATKSPCILHIATHGFFLQDQRTDGQHEQSAVNGSPLPFIHLADRTLENPLLRSGLALAGANSWIKKRPLLQEAQDGILTAEDVAGMDLTSTELVMLSACDTGIGVIQIGEGVFGLRRSFVLAGARSIVMSLWKVPDEQTAELMINFYEQVLNEGESRSSALHHAKLAMMAKYAHPYYWGAFILQGDPASISSIQGSTAHATP